MISSKYNHLFLTGAAALALLCASGAAAQAAEGSAKTVTYPGGKWSPGPARYGAQVVDDVPITMDDGVVLRASVSYPTDLKTGQRAAGTFPVVLEQTPYVKFVRPFGPNTFLTEHGYIYAIARVRGTGKSGGEVANNSPRDAADGKLLVDWAAHRIAGSDGRVALLGCSYPGGLLLNNLGYLGPHSPVKVAVAACVGLNTSRESRINQGLLTAGFFNYGVHGLEYWGSTPAGARFTQDYQKNILAGGEIAYDGSAYWRSRSSLDRAPGVAATGVPILFWAGWGDIVENGAMRTFSAMQNAFAKRPLGAPLVAGQALTPRYQIILGNWAHSDGLDAGIYLEWLDTWLKNVDTGIQQTSTPMHAYEPGTERWVNLPGFTVPQKVVTWRFGPSHAMSREVAAAAGHETLTWGDPDTAGGKVSFETGPVADGATISGPMSVTAYASSTNTNMELLAHLYDVAPDGTAMIISDGAVLGSLRALDEERTWRDGGGQPIWPWLKLTKDEYLTPKRTYRIDFALSPRQWAINPGHRLRLELTTQSPLSVCPATGLPPRNIPDPCRLNAPQQRTVPGGVYSIAYGGATPSSLNMVLLPWKALPEARSAILPTQWSEQQRRIRDTAKGDKLFSLPVDWGS